MQKIAQYASSNTHALLSLQMVNFWLPEAHRNQWKPELAICLQVLCNLHLPCRMCSLHEEASAARHDTVNLQIKMDHQCDEKSA